MLRISVITAVFNRSETVGQSLESVLAQTWHNVEHIVIDGGSTDGTMGIVETYRDRLALIVSERDRGIYDALNKGLTRSTGDVVGFMHSDDFYADERVLERVAEAFENADVEGVYGDLDYVAKDDPRRIIRRWRSGRYTPARLAWGWMPPHPTLYLRRSVIEQWGGFDTNFSIGADYDAMLRYLSRGQIRLAYIPKVLVKMRIGGESNRSVAQILQKSREDYAALRRNDVGGFGTLVLKNLSKVSQFLVF